jgi:hypothetical protein
MTCKDVVHETHNCHVVAMAMDAIDIWFFLL